MRQWWQRRSLRLRLTFWYAITSTVIIYCCGSFGLSQSFGELWQNLA